MNQERAAACGDIEHVGDFGLVWSYNPDQNSPNIYSHRNHIILGSEVILIPDVRTIGLMSAILPFVLGFIMTVYWRERKTYRGFGSWVLANFSFGVGYLFISLRGMIPDILSIILGNIAIVYAEILIYQGIRLFYDRPVFNRLNSLIFVLYIVFQFYFTYLDPDINARIVLISFVLTILQLRSGLNLIDCPFPDLKRTARNAGYIFLITGLLPLTRIIHTLGQGVSTDLFTDELGSWYAVSALFSILLWTFYFFLLNSARLEMDLEFARLELMQIASTDPLTGLYNRRHFFEHAEIEFQRAQRRECNLSFLLLDADEFKSINDNYGHDAGDTVMKDLSAILHREVRAFDLVARFGGDEFIIMLVDVDEEQAYAIAERIRGVVEQTPITFDSRILNIRLSVGLACFDIKDPDLHIILKRADKALYQAKEQGRNRVRTV